MQSGIPNNAIKKTWRPKTAGILSIILGAADIFLGAIVSLVAIGFSVGFGGSSRPGIAGLPLVVLGITDVVGGIFSLSRHYWGMALAGAICGVLIPLIIVSIFIANYLIPLLVGLPFLVMGVLSLIFIVKSKSEFK